jgi:hypothetical protein
MRCPFLFNNASCWAWWYIPVIPALRRLRQEDYEYEASLNYIAKFCLKKKKERKHKLSQTQ